MTVRVPMLNTDTDTAETFRLAMCGLWVPTTALNPRTGVTTTPVLTGTGNLTATVGPFTAMIDGTSGSLQGGYPIALDIATTITIGAGNTQPRIDLICLQVQDNDYDGSGQHRGLPVVVAGTPSGSPVAPATPASAIPLWTVPVAANATSITWASATAVFPYTAAAGGIVPVRNSSDKPTGSAGVLYRHRLDVSVGGVSPLEYSTDNGFSWFPVVDPTIASPWSAWANLTPTSPYTVSTQPRYRTAPGGLVQLSGSVQYTGSTGAVSAATVFGTATLPNTTGNKALLPVIQFSTTMYQGYLVASGTSMAFNSPNIANNAFINLDSIIWATG